MESEDSVFYSHERWTNWINRLKECEFSLDDEKGDSGKEFVYMEDDIILACLKILAKYDREHLSRESAIEELLKVRDIIIEEVEPINEAVDLMLTSLQTSLMGVIAACECYINRDYTDIAPSELIAGALKAEAEDDIPGALYNIAQVGARIISDNLVLDDSDLDNVPDSLVAEWLDGLDSLSAAMIGDDSYKNDEPDDK